VKVVQISGFNIVQRYRVKMRELPEQHVLIYPTKATINEEPVVTGKKTLIIKRIDKPLVKAVNCLICISEAS